MNRLHTTLFSTLLLLLTITHAARAAQPALDQALPTVAIEERGEVILEGDEIVFRPWQSDAQTGEVRVIQYLAATRSASEVFEPFTDRLQTLYEPGVISVISIINLKAALWGTSGFVLSEVKKNKRKHPESTIVIDKDGTGQRTWALDKKGAALLILDKTGTVRFFAKSALADGQLDESVALVEKLHNE